MYFFSSAAIEGTVNAPYNISYSIGHGDYGASFTNNNYSTTASFTESTGNAGYFTNGTFSATFAGNSSYAGTFTDSSGHFVAMTDGSTALYATDGTNVVNLGYNGFAITAAGDVLLDDGYGASFLRVKAGGDDFYNGITVHNSAGGTAVNINSYGINAFATDSDGVQTSEASLSLQANSYANLLVGTRVDTGQKFQVAGTSRFTDGTQVIDIISGSYGIDYKDNLNSPVFTAGFGGGAGVYANDSTNNVSLADGTYAINATGNVNITGKITATGGVDPPYVLIDEQTKVEIVERVRKEIPANKASGFAIVNIPNDKRIKWFKPIDCGFYGEKVDENGWIVKILIETYNDGKICYNNEEE